MQKQISNLSCRGLGCRFFGSKCFNSLGNVRTELSGCHCLLSDSLEQRSNFIDFLPDANACGKLNNFHLNTHQKSFLTAGDFSFLLRSGCVLFSFGRVKKQESSVLIHQKCRPLCDKPQGGVLATLQTRNFCFVSFAPF